MNNKMRSLKDIINVDLEKYSGHWDVEGERYRNIQIHIDVLPQNIRERYTPFPPVKRVYVKTIDRNLVHEIPINI